MACRSLYIASHHAVATVFQRKKLVVLDSIPKPSNEHAEKAQHQSLWSALSVLFWCFFLCAVHPASGSENHWTAAGGDNLWTNAANWSLGIVPDASQDVVIAPIGTDPVMLNGAAEVASCTLGSDLGGAAL